MGSIPGILFFIIGLVISVGIHELGHLIPAKKFGAKVSQYFIGFGPTLWSRHYKGTEYGIKAIPLGGFVRIAGMLAPARAGVVTTKSDGTATMAEEARQESAAELAPGEENQAFWRLSPGKRLVVMFGGPFTNFLLAVMCMGVVLCGIGTATPSTEISTVLACSAEKCESGDPVSPAAAAGIQAGDTIESWGGTEVSRWSDIQEAIAQGGTEPTEVVVRRGGETLRLTVTPQMRDVPVYDESGKAATTSDGAVLTQSKPYVGIAPAYVREPQSIASLPGTVWDLAAGTVGVITRLPIELWNTAASLVTGADRSTSGVIGIVGVADIAGSITSTQAAQYTLMARLGDLLMLMASLNMSLFIFNLIPLLPLDGGHMVGAAWEWLRSRVARLRGKPDPGPVDMARALPLSWGVGAAFVLMAILLIVADIVNPVL